VERESSLLAESIRARSASRPIAAPVWTAREVQRVEADFDRLARANRQRLRRLAANATQERPYCVYLQSRMFTRPDAALLLCCNSPPAELPSLQRTASRDAWNGRQRRALIEQFLSDAPPAFCANCAERSFRPLSLLLDTAFPAGLESYLAAPAIRTGWWERWFRASGSM
jgi:hypothetical protein